MTIVYVTTSTTGTGVLVTLPTGDDLFVAENATLGSTNNSAVVGAGNGHNLRIYGTVVGQTRTLDIGDDLSASGQKLFVAEGGLVANIVAAGPAAVQILGNNNLIDNRGSIIGTGAAICIGGDNPLATTTINNSGLIEAGSNTTAIFRFSGSTVDKVVLTNTGEIRAGGNANAYSGGSAVDQIINNGLMVGDVSLSGGDDLYDARGGGRLTGTVIGFNGMDKLFGGGFADTFLGGLDSDELDGGGGDDTLDGGDHADTIRGGAGIDSLLGGLDADELDGGDGNDSVDGGGGVDTITGGAGNDSLLGGLDADELDGGDGDDSLDGGGGVDIIIGGAGNDSLLGGVDADTLSGGLGNDFLNGGLGVDAMAGATGNDIYVVENLLDVVSEAGGSGIDTVIGSISFDLTSSARVVGAIENLTLQNVGTALTGAGNNLNNTITGNGLANTVLGRAGGDILKGGAGADTLNGGLGVDTLSGQLHSDFFVFNVAPTAANRDIITDFSNVAGNNDTIRLENAVFTKVGGAGALSAAAFHLGAAAHDASDRIIYNKATGAVIYDLNGNAAGGATVFAVLSNKAALTVADFVVI
jgi:Ca2+-binding RTX toxin-like protein